jgi:hypothetical protein
MSGAIPPLPQYAFMSWCLVKYRDNFTFYLYLYLYLLCHRRVRFVIRRIPMMQHTPYFTRPMFASDEWYVFKVTIGEGSDLRLG